MTEERDARRKLDRLLVDLRLLRNQLGNAQRERLPFMVDRAQQEIRKQHILILRHCKATGRPQPAGVAEDD